MEKVEFVCNKCGTKFYAFNFKSKVNKFCSNHCKVFKTGRYIAGGYIYIYSPNHPSARKTRYILEHRLAMEKKMGRFLVPTEIVHHINGNTLDNRVSNLKLMTKKEHQILHNGKK